MGAGAKSYYVQGRRQVLWCVVLWTDPSASPSLSPVRRLVAANQPFRFTSVAHVIQLHTPKDTPTDRHIAQAEPSDLDLSTITAPPPGTTANPAIIFSGMVLRCALPEVE